MTILNKEFASGFFAGIAALFTVMSILLMNPEHMWRWLLHPDSVEEKVERALTEPREHIQKLKSKIIALQEELIQAKLKSESREKSILEENKRLNTSTGKLERERDALKAELESRKNVNIPKTIINTKKLAKIEQTNAKEIIEGLSKMYSSHVAKFLIEIIPTLKGGVSCDDLAIMLGHGNSSTN